MRLFNRFRKSCVTLKDSTVLLTGAAGAIGSATARQLVQDGARLALVDIDDERLEALASELRKSNPDSVKCYVADLLADDQLKQLPERVERDVGPIDIFISSAGVEFVGFIHSAAIEDIDRQIAMHLRVPMILTAALLPKMLERDKGHVLLVASMAGKLPLGAKAPYAAAKAGAIAFVNSIRRELENTGVNASVVIPGLVKGGGQGDRAIQSSSVKHEDISGGSITAEQCAKGIIECIKHGTAERMINPRNPMIIVAVNALWPSLADWMLKRVGAFDFWMRVARDTKRS